MVDKPFAQSVLANINPRENAIVTSLYTDAFAVTIATLGESLNKVNSTARRIVFYLPGRVSEQALCIASLSGFEPHPVPRVEPPAGGEGVMLHFVDQFTKLSIWGFDKLGIKALVYIDADTLALRNFDELFALPFTFGAVGDVYTDHRGFTTNFNAGVLFVRPDSTTFRDLAAKVHTTPFHHWEAEQAFLNVFYGPQTVRLPYIYNGNLAIKPRNPAMWEGMQNEMRILHFSLLKPFWRKVYDEIGLDKMHENARNQSREWEGQFEYEIMLWDRYWRETEDKYGQEIMHCGWKSAKVREPHTGV